MADDDDDAFDAEEAALLAASVQSRFGGSCLAQVVGVGSRLAGGVKVRPGSVCVCVCLFLCVFVCVCACVFAGPVVGVGSRLGRRGEKVYVCAWCVSMCFGRPRARPHRRRVRTSRTRLCSRGARARRRRSRCCDPARSARCTYSCTAVTCSWGRRPLLTRRVSSLSTGAVPARRDGASRRGRRRHCRHRRHCRRRDAPPRAPRVAAPQGGRL